jgi:hypothetical protein
MLLKITNFKDELAEKLKEFTGAATASKAVDIVANDYIDNQYYISKLHDEIKDLKDSLKEVSDQNNNIKSALKILKEL